eukprot:853973-Prorocentrum_lima.AAC.1
MWRLSVRSRLLLLLGAATCRVPSEGLFGDLEPPAFIGPYGRFPQGAAALNAELLVNLRCDADQHPGRDPPGEPP